MTAPPADEEALARRWARFRGLPFPEAARGELAAGVDLVWLDADTAGCIDAVVVSGALDAQRRRLLDACLADLTAALPQLPDAARPYFEELALVARSAAERMP